MRFSVMLSYFVALAAASPAPVTPSKSNLVARDCSWDGTGLDCGTIIADFLLTAETDGITLPWLISQLPEVSPGCVVSAIGGASACGDCIDLW
ncbi:hypothetical protein N7532_007848 [Penicillium argentinense]|uniref:Uncharacterized protein n=1 Tax=Penicillium argentinense TaxID=1131581 RepID=A0A9W9EWF0_9EURO|nr:uncharacterized protein N7532_007848 [Penicillium argentinense]KAJ5089164.1 hypothetical protein N7532_007848 [Penicillium argentinense]